MPLTDNLAKSIGPLVERVALQCELCQLASALDCGRRLDVAARDALAAAVAVIETKRDGRFRYPVCTENLIRVDDVMESPKLAE